MIYLGIVSGKHRNLFMHLPGNIVFTSAHAEFNEKLFSCYKATVKQRSPDPNTQLPYSKNLSELKSDDDLPYCQPPITLQNRKTHNDKGTADDNQQAHLPVQNPSQLHLNQDKGKSKEEESQIIPPRRNPPLVHNMPCCVGNIYGEDRHPIDQLKNTGKQNRRTRSQEYARKETNPAIEEEQQGYSSPSYTHQNKNPGIPSHCPSNNDFIPDPVDYNSPDNIKMEELACLCHEEGAPLINHLIKFVYSLDEDRNKSEYELDISKVQEQQYRNITKIKDPDICKEFEYICQDELEALQ